MSRAENAAFDQVVEMNGRKFGQVTVQMEGDDRPYIVMICKEPGGELKLASVFAKDAEYEIDWYDNSLHNAYEDVTDDIFVGETNQRNDAIGMDQHSLLGDVLGFSDVRQQLDDKLK